MTHPQSFRTALFALALLAGILGAVPGAQALGLMGNLPQSDDSLGTNFNVSTTQEAVVFTLGSTAYTIDNVVLRLGNYDTTTGGDIARLGFFLDNGSGTNVGAQVGSFLTSPVSASNTISTFTFLPSGTVTLSANTKYWLRLDRSGGNFDWMGPGAITNPSGIGATYDSYKISTNTGTSWAPNTFVTNSFQINATVVPEPGSALLLAVAGAGLLARRRR